MESEELSRIVELLESSNVKDDAYFAMCQYGGGLDESYIKANKEGLHFFAIQLLKASKVIEDFDEDEKEQVVELESFEEWIKGDILIQHIVLIKEKREETNKEDDLGNNDKWGGVVITSVFIFFVITFLIGLGTIINWVV